MTSTASDPWVVYSPNESAVSDSAGFWSNEFSWVFLDQATRFSEEKAGSLQLPLSTGRNARFVPWQEAQRYYG